MSPASDHNVALYSILVDGSELPPELAKGVREIKVQNYLRLPDMCTLSLAFQAGKPGEAQPIDGHPFEIGKPLEIKLGATEDMTTSSLFKGEIVTLEPHFGAGGIEMLVRGLDRSHHLMRSRRSVSYTNSTASDIVRTIVTAAGFEANCDPSGDPYDHIYQHNETDWDFIWRLAERVGFEFFIADQTAHFRAPVTDAPVELEWPKTLRSFNPRVTAIQQVSEVTVRAWNPKTKKEIMVTVSDAHQIAKIGIDRDKIKGAFGKATIDVNEPVFDEAQAKRIAQALLDKLANGYVAAEGLCDGNPQIKAGTAIHVTGLGNMFSGTYRVASTTHVLRGGATYATHFANSPAHTLSGLIGSGNGRSSFPSQIVVGTVTNNSDPDDMGRVKVKYPTLSPDVDGTWARIVSPSAGNARGLMMLPVVGEEVLIAFEHEDITRPYVLGSLFNGVDKPGDDLVQSKDGSFALLSDHKIVAHSKEDMKLTSDGPMTIDVAGDFALTGKGNIKAEARQSVSIKATQDVTIEGTTSVTIKCGGSQVQVSPSGVTVSGPMISLG